MADEKPFRPWEIGEPVAAQRLNDSFDRAIHNVHASGPITVRRHGRGVTIGVNLSDVARIPEGVGQYQNQHKLMVAANEVGFDDPRWFAILPDV
jgi:hypothetical protein